MKRLELNFAGRSRATRWAGCVLMALAGAFAIDAAVSYNAVKGSIAAEEARLSQQRPRSAPAVRVSPEELAAVRDTVERIGLPWDQLFGALESAASDQVALLGIEPDPKSGTVMISGDGKDYLAALSYVLNLSQVETLQRVQLVRHETRANDANGAVSFAVSAAWKEARK